MKKVLLAVLFSIVSTNAVASSASDVTKFRARIVDLSQSKATLYKHESILFGFSCSSGPVGTLQNVPVVKLGDTITVGGISFHVGIIEVSKYNEDMKFGNEILAKKGDFVCVLAPDEKLLPYNDACEAIWVNAPGCRVIE